MNIKDIYHHLIDLRNRMTDDENNFNVLDDDHFKIDHVLDLLEALENNLTVVYDNNNGAKELQVGLKEYDDEQEAFIIRVHDFK